MTHVIRYTDFVVDMPFNVTLTQQTADGITPTKPSESPTEQRQA